MNLHAAWRLGRRARTAHVCAHIRTADGGYSVVEGISILHSAQPMYNLTVDTAHTFFVGDVGALVHNASCTIQQVESDSRVSEIREKFGIKPDERNVGIGDYYDNDNNLVESAVGISAYHTPGGNPYPGTVDLLPTDQRRFTTLKHSEAYPSSNPTFDFNHAVDSEARILEHYANRFDPHRTGGNPNIDGKLVLYTERFPCPSCGGSTGLEGVIGQFHTQFPNIGIEINYTTPKPH